jgi:hypothetical protein
VSILLSIIFFFPINDFDAKIIDAPELESA